MVNTQRQTVELFRSRVCHDHRPAEGHTPAAQAGIRLQGEYHAWCDGQVACDNGPVVDRSTLDSAFFSALELVQVDAAIANGPFRWKAVDECCLGPTTRLL